VAGAGTFEGEMGGLMSDERASRRRELMRALQGDAATLLADLESYRSDLSRAVFACERIMIAGKGRLDHDTMQLVYESAIMSYARCFASGVRMRLPFDLQMHMSDEARDFHEQMLLIRDKLLAHAVSPLETVIPISVLADPETDDPGVESVGAILFRPAWNLRTDAPRLLALSRGLLGIVEVEIDRLKDAILTELRRGDVGAMYDEPQISFSGKKSETFISRRRPAPGTHPSGKPWPLA